MKVIVKIDGYEVDSTSVSYSYGINSVGSIDIGISPQELETYEAYGKPLSIELDNELVYTGNIISVEQNYSPMSRQTQIKGISNWFPYYRTGTLFYFYQKFTKTPIYNIAALTARLGDILGTQIDNNKFGEQLKETLLELNKVVMTQPIGKEEYVADYIKLIAAECPLAPLITKLDTTQLNPPQLRVNSFSNLFEAALKQPNMNFYNLLMILSEYYQFILINDKDKCQLIPNAPLVAPKKPYIELNAINAYSIEGFPIEIPTRAEVVFGRTLSNGGIQPLYEEKGYYPADRNKLTKLENKLKSSSVYDKVYIVPNFIGDIRQLAGQIASSEYANIVCKDRIMNINMPLNNTYRVGEVIGINIGKRYTGRIHSIRTTVELNQTQLQLTHVLSDTEKNILDLGSYQNTLYPDFKGI